MAEANSKAPSIHQTGWTQENGLPSVPSAASALSSRSEDDVDSDISRFKLLLPLRPKSGAAADVASSFPSERKVRRGGLRERPFLPCIENLALHRNFLGGELRQLCHPDQDMVPAPLDYGTTHSTGKAWFYLSRFLCNALPLLFQFQPYRIFASFWNLF